MRRFFSLLLLISLLTACAGLPSVPGLGTGISREQLLAGEPILSVQPLPELPDVDLLAVSDEMQQFLDHYVDSHATARDRLQQLLYAIINKGTLGISYNNRTRTAADTFRTRSGNCLSFTTMFIALARAVGLEASFQQVEIPPSWDQRGDTLILNRHINAIVGVSTLRQNAAEQIVDFNIVDFKTSYRSDEVSDTRAVAHYFNNLGVEKLHAGEYLDSFLHFRRGLEADSRFGTLWTNLGTLYLRIGEFSYAEASYHEAHKTNRADTVALSNLAKLYDRQGRTELAEKYRYRVQRHRMRNPYYRAEKAEEAYTAGDLRDAMKHINFALDRKPEEGGFHYQQSLIYRALGNVEAALSALQRAETLSPEDRFTARFNETLRNHSNFLF